MNKQQIFDTVVKHLAAQKTRALSVSRWACAYRGNNGTMCAVGCLIPDEDYLPYMEGKSVTTLKVLDVLPDYLRNDLGMLIDLQVIHDDCAATPYSIRQDLSDVAVKYDLDPNAVELITEWKP